MHSRIAKKMLIWVSSLVIIPIIFVVVINDYQSKQIIVQQIFNTFNVVIDSMRTQLLSYIESKKDRTKDFAASRFLKDTLREIDKYPEQLTLINKLNEYLVKDKLPLDKDVYDILVFDKKERFVASSYKTLRGIPVNKEYFLKGRHEIAIKTTEYINSERLFSISAPIAESKSGEFLGVITLRFRISSVDNILKTEAIKLWGNKNELEIESMGRIFITDNAKTVIASSSKYLLGKVINIEPIEYAFGMKKERIGEFEGIFGKDRLGASLIFKEIGWVLIISISKDEVFSSVNKFMIIALLRIGIGMVLVVILILFVSHKIAKPITDIANAAERITEGHWDERVAIKEKKGEIATLANAFNEMIRRLQENFRALKHSEHFNEKIIQTITSGLIVLNRDFIVLSVNRSFCEMFGITLSEAVGKPVAEVLKIIGISEEGIKAVSHRDCFSKLECNFKLPSGEEKPIKLSLTNIQDEDEIILLFD